MSDRQLSYGVELELADVDCSKDIPSNIGSWEGGNIKNKLGYYIGYETCIMNTDGTAVDPHKEKVFKGGEVHVVPSYDIETLVNRITDIFKIFPEAKMFLPGKMHIHIGLPEWTLDEYKNIIEYVKDNELAFMEYLCPDSFMDEMISDNQVSNDLSEHYLSSRKTVNNPELFEKIKDYDTKQELIYWWGKRCLYYFPRPMVYFHNKYVTSKQNIRVQSIHLQHLLCHNTIEFRNFAPTTDINLLRNCIIICDKFIKEGLKGKSGEPIMNWIKDYNIAEWTYDAKIIQAWWTQAKNGDSHIHHDKKHFHNIEPN